MDYVYGVVYMCICMDNRYFLSTISSARIYRFEHSIHIDGETFRLVFGKGRSSRFGETEQKEQNMIQ